MPVLQILAQYDHLVPPAASKPFNDLVGSDEVTTIEYPTGHVGLAMSANAHRDVWPEVAHWFREQIPHPTLADVIGEGAEQALGVDIETDLTTGEADEIEIGIADESGDIARALVADSPAAIEQFIEDALDVEISVETADTEITVTVDTDGRTEETVLENVGEAIRSEVVDAITGEAIATAYDLTDIDGVGPTYAEKLRNAGIDSLTALATADPTAVAEQIQVSEELVREWTDEAQALEGINR